MLLIYKKNSFDIIQPVFFISFFLHEIKLKKSIMDILSKIITQKTSTNKITKFEVELITCIDVISKKQILILGGRSKKNKHKNGIITLVDLRTNLTICKNTYKQKTKLNNFHLIYRTRNRKF